MKDIFKNPTDVNIKSLIYILSFLSYVKEDIVFNITKTSCKETHPSLLKQNSKFHAFVSGFLHYLIVKLPKNSNLWVIRCSETFPNRSVSDPIKYIYS